ncbi:MAG: PD-(D/E)XK nuclease family protein [Acidobacteria bacterium]|nr:PD-(D/E)XK nuclease family protein [Acidobacteriota bacterium]
MPVYSHSRLETFENCPLKYKFRYIDGIKKAEQGVEAFLGGLVHEVLRKLYDDLQLEKLDTLDELLDFFAARWKQAWGPHVRIVRASMTEQNYFDYGTKCIRNFYERNAPFRQSQTLGTEVHLTFPLDGEGKYQLQGYVDRIARRADGTIEIHDYKTSRTLPAQEKADADRQLALYQIGVQRQWPEARGVELIWHYVAFRETQRSCRTAQQLVQLRHQTIELIDRVEQTTRFDGKRSNLCDWCEYKPDCPLWQHPDSVLALPPAQFKADDGVRLADEYTKIKFERDTLELRLEQLKEQVIAFARQRNLRIIQGSGAQLSVRLSEAEKFPGKREEERAALEALLKGAGKWEEISELDTAALAHALENAHWPAALVAEVRRFATQVERVSVTLHRDGKGSGEEKS